MRVKILKKLIDNTICKIVFIDILSVIAAYFLVNYLDIITTDYRWIQWMKVNGLFHIYDSWEIDLPVDYPPLYLIWLYLIRDFVGNTFSSYTQLIMKVLPLSVQILAQIWIYKRISPEAALKWSINIALLVNIVIYGQRDGIIGFLIVLLFYYMKKEKWLEPAIIVAVFCLLKPQGIYFVFLLLFYYFVNRTPIKYVFIAALSCLMLGYLAFLPFAITSGDYLVAIKLYLYEFSIHKVFASVAGNIWGLFEYWPLPYWLERISILLILGCMLICILVYRGTTDFIFSSIVYMISIFMLTISQHGRYSIYAMFIMFAAIYIYGNDKYNGAYRIITISTVLAQLGMILYNRIIVGEFGLNVINVTVEMTYSMLHTLYAVRYITIVSTLLLNIICIIHLIQIKKPGFLKSTKSNASIE